MEPAQETKPVETQQTEQPKVEEPKVEQPKAEPKAEPEPTLEDFARMDIRVGKITEVWKHPESDKLYCEKINIGDEVREIGSGLQKFVTEEQMTDGLVLVLANLKSRKLAGFPSFGMVVCASNDDHTAVELLRPAPDSKIGERVVLEGYEGISQDKEKVIDPKKKKVLEIVLPHLKTDENGYAVFQGKRLCTSAGPIKASTLCNANIG